MSEHPAPSLIYADHLSVRTALQLYFSKYHFEHGGYDLAWFKIKLGPVFIPLPNTKGRIAAVKMHDIHHLVTEYPATLCGEAEIAGWEIASGCGPYPAAWLLNFGSFFYGLFFYPGPLFRAFMQGRKCRTNLYHDTIYDAVLLNRTVGEVRQTIGLPTDKKNSLADYGAFALMTLVALWPAWLCFWTITLVR